MRVICRNMMEKRPSSLQARSLQQSELNPSSQEISQGWEGAQQQHECNTHSHCLKHHSDDDALSQCERLPQHLLLLFKKMLIFSNHPGEKTAMEKCKPDE